MAYMPAERKNDIVTLAKPILKKYGVKATFRRDRSSITVTLKSGPIDFIGNHNSVIAKDFYMRARGWSPAERYMDVNPYHFREHFAGKAKYFLIELFEALNTGNYDNSDISADYFHVGWYTYVKVGTWQKPYEVKK